MAEERQVHPDCRNASNPYHECVDYCFRKIAESKALSAKRETGSVKMKFMMDQIPVEVIGHILSHLKEARDIVIASATCRKWQDAWRNHVHKLSFYKNHPCYALTTTRLEILITNTIFQTNGLRSLSILFHNAEGQFSTTIVNAWLMQTRKTLRELSLSIPVAFNFSDLQKCGLLKLEALSLSLGYGKWIGVVDSYQKFPCLKSFSLTEVCLSLMNLNLVLAACPTIQELNLSWVQITLADGITRMKLSSNSLKSLSLSAVSIGRDEFILEADNIEKLHLGCNILDLFALVGNGSLKILSMDRFDIKLLNIGVDTDNLEEVEIYRCCIRESLLYNIIKKASSLMSLDVCMVNFSDIDDILDIGIIPMCSPRLSYLSLNCDIVKYEFLHNGLKVDEACLEDLVALKLRGNVEGDILSLLRMLLQKCPNLKNVVILGVMMITRIGHCIIISPELNYDARFTSPKFNHVGRFTSSIIQLMKMYTQVGFSLEFEQHYQIIQPGLQYSVQQLLMSEDFVY